MTEESSIYTNLINVTKYSSERPEKILKSHFMMDLIESQLSGNLMFVTECNEESLLQ